MKEVTGAIMGVVLAIFFIWCIFYILRFVWRIIRGDKYVESSNPLEKIATKKDEKPTKILINVIGGLGGALIFWYLFSYEPEASYKISAKQLYKEFKLNKLAALAKYQDEYVLVTGKPKISDMVGSNPVIGLDTSFFGGGILCAFPSSKLEEVSTIKKGKQVTLKGRVRDLDEQVVLDNCSIKH